jgi:23S rRNA (cytidine2498-2'-O)-methyltransferase
MDPRLAAFDRDGSVPRLRHLKEPVGALRRTDLPRPLHWIVSDMNLAPRVVLRYLERSVGPSRATLLGAIVTLKLNDLAMASEIPELCERLRGFGFERVMVAQLPSNRREVCAVGLTARGLARSPSGRAR